MSNEREVEERRSREVRLHIELLNRRIRKLSTFGASVEQRVVRHSPSLDSSSRVIDLSARAKAKAKVKEQVREKG